MTKSQKYWRDPPLNSQVFVFFFLNTWMPFDFYFLGQFFFFNKNWSKFSIINKKMKHNNNSKRFMRCLLILCLICFFAIVSVFMKLSIDCLGVPCSRLYGSKDSEWRSHYISQKSRQDPTPFDNQVLVLLDWH